MADRFGNAIDSAEGLVNSSPTLNTSPTFENPMDAAQNYGYVPSGESTNINVDEYKEYIPKGVFSGRDINLERAIAQPLSEQLLGFTNQLIVGEIAGGFIEGAGYLLDLPQYYNLIKGTETEFSNILSDVGIAIKESAREATPIYEETPGEINFGDPAFWASGMVSVGSSLSLALPGLGVLKGASALSKSMRVLQGLNNISKTTKVAITGVALAGMSRQMEGVMEAAQVKTEEYEKFLEAGFSEEEATKAASEAAANTYKANLPLVLMDIPQYLLLAGGLKLPQIQSLKVAKALGKSTGSALALKGAELGFQMASEGFEEAYQFISAEEAKYYTELSLGLAEPKSTAERMSEYYANDQLWSSAMFGALGGGVFAAAGPKVHDLILKSQGKHEQTDAYQEDKKVENIKSWANNLAMLNKRVREADASGNVAWSEQARTELNAHQALKELNFETFDYYINFLEDTAKMSAEEVAEYNKDKAEELQLNFEEVQKNFPSYIEDARAIQGIYNKHSKKYEANLASQVTLEEFRRDKYSNMIEPLKKEISDLVASVPNLEQLSSTGKMLMDNTSNINKLTSTIKQVEFLLKSEDITEQSKQSYTDQLSRLKEAKDYYLDIQKKVKTEDTRNPDEKNKDSQILKSFTTKEDITKKEAKLEFLNAAIEASNDNIKRLTNKKFVKDNSQSLYAKAYTNSRVEDALKNVAEDSEISFNGTKGTVAKDPASNKFVFTSTDGSIVREITPENLELLFIESAEDVSTRKTKVANELKYRKNLETLNQFQQSISDRHNNVISKIEEKKKLLDSKFRSIEYVEEYISNPNIDSKGRTYYKDKSNKRISKAKVQEQLSELRKAHQELDAEISILEENKAALEEQLFLIQEDLKDLNANRYTYSIEDKLNAVTATLENITKDIEELKKASSELLDYINWVDELLKKDDELKEFIKRYPGAPSEYNLTDINNFLKREGDFVNQYPDFLPFLKANPNYIRDLKALSENKKFNEDELFISMADANRLASLLRDSEEQYKQLSNSKKRYEYIQNGFKTISNIVDKQIKEADKKNVVDDTQKASNEELEDPSIEEVEELDKVAYELGDRKSLINTTAGLNIIESTETENQEEGTYTFFRTLSKLGAVKEGDYKLEFVTENSPKEMFERAFTDSERKYIRDNNYEGSIKVILVDKNNKPIKVDRDGNIGKGDLLVSIGIHRPEFVKNLSPKRLVEKYLFDIHGVTTDINDIKFPINLSKAGEFTFDELVSKAREYYSEQQSQLRSDVLKAISTGKRVGVSVITKSNGKPIREKNADGSRKRNPISNFAKSSNIKAIHIPTSSGILSTDSGANKRVKKGIAYVEDVNGNIIDSITRPLEDKEIGLIVDLLDYALNKTTKNKEDWTVANADKKSKIKSFNIFNSSKNKFGLIPSIIAYGKSNNKYGIYFADGYLHFGDNQIIKVDQIATSEELKSFLSTKKFNIRKSLLGNKEASFYFPTSFNKQTGEVTVKLYSPKDKLGGYEQFLLSKDALGTDLVPQTELQFAQSYLVFDNNIESITEEAPIVENKVENKSEKVLNSKIDLLPLQTSAEFKELKEGSNLQVILDNRIKAILTKGKSSLSVVGFKDIESGEAKEYSDKFNIGFKSMVIDKLNELYSKDTITIDNEEESLSTYLDTVKAKISVEVQSPIITEVKGIPSQKAGFGKKKEIKVEASEQVSSKYPAITDFFNSLDGQLQSELKSEAALVEEFEKEASHIMDVEDFITIKKQDLGIC